MDQQMNAFWSYFHDILNNTHHPNQQNIIKYMLRLYLAKMREDANEPDGDISYTDCRIISSLVKDINH